MDFGQVILSPLTLVDEPGPLPADLSLLPVEALADISAGNKDAATALQGRGWWPAVTATPAYDVATRTPDGTFSWVPDEVTRTIIGTANIRAMTAAEAAAANPVPTMVTATQAKLALLAVGKLDATQDAINAIVDPIKKRTAQIKFDAANWYRADPDLSALGMVIGVDSDQQDALFRAAAKIGV